MANGYQQIKNYKGNLYGEPEYAGLEYDWEVPDNMVISSPGGASAVHHHYTKGMYGSGATMWDIYGGEGKRYPYGEHGNVYQTGQSSAQQAGLYYPAPDKMYTQNQSTAHRDNFTGIEMIPAPDVESFTTSPKQKVAVLNPWMLFLIFAIVYMALDLWIRAGESFIVTRFHQGKELDFKWLIFYAVLFTILAIVVASLVKIPLISIEQI